MKDEREVKFKRQESVALKPVILLLRSFAMKFMVWGKKLQSEINILDQIIVNVTVLLLEYL